MGSIERGLRAELRRAVREQHRLQDCNARQETIIIQLLVEKKALLAELRANVL